MPGKVKMKEALRFAKALARGEKGRWDIIKTVVEDRAHEVV
jgi:hypothetical protein